MEANTEKPTV